jgi:hypothetical protein
MNSNSNSEVQVKKYAVALDPVKVSRMRHEARRAAVREGRDVSWVGLLRGLMDRFLAEVGGVETNIIESGHAGGAR